MDPVGIEVRVNVVDPQHYPLRITTFIDILGFARDVLALSSKPSLYVSVDAVLRHIADCRNTIDRKRQEGIVRFDHRMTQFSDCVVMSYVNTPGASLRAVSDAAFIGQVILRAGYLPRGAITLGHLVHNNDIVFGDALVNAHHLESTTVSTPRIMLNPDVLSLVQNDLSREQPDDRLDMYVRDFGSGPFVHILGEHWPFLTVEKEKQRAGIYDSDGVQEMYEELHAMLPIRYENAPHRRAASKIEWMRDYVNSAITEYQHSNSFKVHLAGEFSIRSWWFKRMARWARRAVAGLLSS